LQANRWLHFGEIDLVSTVSKIYGQKKKLPKKYWEKHGGGARVLYNSIIV
jgi:hypothetical protein